MMIATVTFNGQPIQAIPVDSLDLAIPALLRNFPLYPIGSILAIETVTGVLLYSVSIPWQMD